MGAWPTVADRGDRNAAAVHPRAALLHVARDGNNLEISELESPQTNLRPMGFAPGKNRCAIVSLMATTRGDDSLSRFVKSRPVTRGYPSSRSTPGLRHPTRARG